MVPSGSFILRLTDRVAALQRRHLPRITVAKSAHQDTRGGTLLSETQAEYQAEQAAKQAQQAVQSLAELIDERQQIGDLIGIDFGIADVLVHDALKEQAGGVPHSCFLLATRFC